MMLIHDASGAVAVVSAESVRIVGEGCIGVDGKRRGRSQVKNEVERCFVAHCSSFLRCLKGLVCAITSLSLRRKEPNRPSMNQGAVK